MIDLRGLPSTIADDDVHKVLYYQHVAAVDIFTGLRHHDALYGGVQRFKRGMR